MGLGVINCMITPPCSNYVLSRAGPSDLQRGSLYSERSRAEELGQSARAWPSVCPPARVLCVVRMLTPDLTKHELTVQALLLSLDCLRIFFKFSFHEMTEWVRRGWWALIIVFKPHGRRRFVHNDPRQQLRLWPCCLQVIAILFPNLNGNNKFLG